MFNFLSNIFKSSNQRRIDDYGKIVRKINLKEEETAKLSEEEFKKINLSTDDALVEVFAADRKSTRLNSSHQ